MFGRSDGEQKLVTGEGGARLQFAETCPVGFEFLLPHGTFFGPSGQAAGEDVEFVVLFEEFDVDVVFDFFLGFFGEAFFELGQAPLGGADEVVDAGVCGAHFF